MSMRLPTMMGEKLAHGFCSGKERVAQRAADFGTGCDPSWNGAAAQPGRNPAFRWQGVFAPDMISPRRPSGRRSVLGDSENQSFEYPTPRPKAIPAPDNRSSRG
jgi:hypothetical protein